MSIENTYLQPDLLKGTQKMLAFDIEIAKELPDDIGDFKAQLWRTYNNITNLLAAEDMTWHDVVRTTNYLRDIGRDYVEFNKIRTTFYSWHGLDPLPAATGIQAILCWETLLVEIEMK